MGSILPDGSLKYIVPLAIVPATLALWKMWSSREEVEDPNATPREHAGILVGEVLKAHGVEVVFTLTGGHIAPILVGCKSSGLRVIDVRHEASTVFAADAVARLSGIPGVAIVTAGPGLTNTITAVKNAQLACSPVVILAGATSTLLKGRGSLQDVNQQALMAPHVKWQTSIQSLGELVPKLRRAFQVCRSGVPGPVFVEFPLDILYREDDVRAMVLKDVAKMKGALGYVVRWYVKRHLDQLFSGTLDAARAFKGPLPVTIPTPTASWVSHVAQELKRAKRPILVIGSGAMQQPSTVDALRQAVQSLGVPTYLAGMARGLLGRENAQQMRHKRREALKEADVVLLAGVPMDFRLEYGNAINRDATLFSISRSKQDVYKNRWPTRGYVCDAGMFLRKLADVFVPTPNQWEEWLTVLRGREADREAWILDKAEVDIRPLNPVRVCQLVEEHLPPNALLIADGGDFVGTSSYTVKPRQPLTWMDPGVFGTLGVGGGFAMGSKAICPQKEVYIIYGDGSCGYSLAEFDTYVRHNLPVVALVGNDACWMQMYRDQVRFFKDDVGSVLSHTNYENVAKGFGAEGILVERVEDVPAALQRASEFVRNGKPVLVNFLLGRSDFREGSISL